MRFSLSPRGELLPSSKTFAVPCLWPVQRKRSTLLPMSVGSAREAQHLLKADQPHPRDYSTHRQTPWADNDFIEMECWSVVIQWGNSAALPLRSWVG